MSHRPQEPPRSVSRDHRLTSLKTSGIVARYSRLRRCQKIRSARGFVAINQDFRNSPFCAASARHAFTEKIRKKLLTTAPSKLTTAMQPSSLKSHGHIGAQRI